MRGRTESGKANKYIMSDSSPLISVIIPTSSQRQHFLKRAVNSVLYQTFTNFEMLIIYDGDHDVMEKFVQEVDDNRIRYISVDPGDSLLFVSKKRNIGVQESDKDSRYIAFLDDDDEFLPDFLKESVVCFERNKQIGVVASWVELRMHDGTFLKRKKISPEKFWETPIGNLWVLKKEIFLIDNVWFDDKTVFEDLDFGVRIPQKYKREIVPQYLRLYYALTQKKGDSSSTKFGRQADNILYFFEKNREIYRGAGKQATAFLYFMVGKIFCQAGRFSAGRTYLLKAIFSYPKLRYLIYYFCSMFFPFVFVSHRLLILKHKLLKDRL